jgi:murein DD-endopeptidase MepM/ murein hydrolase activator NlpD
MSRSFFPLLFLAAVLLSACQSSPTTPEPASSTNQQITSPPVDSNLETPSDPRVLASPTAVLASGEADPEETTQPIIQIPTPAPDPLRFVFPTQGPVPVSAWRPPLYPTPWALTPYDHFYFARPIAADEVNWPLADYRYGGVFLPNVVHTGIDIPAPKGTPVLAAGSGKVTWAGYGLYRGVEDLTDPYGLAIAIKHDFGFKGETLYTVYGHLDQIYVVKGQHVETGDVLGLVGETGKVTGPHLHFEVRVGKNNYFVSRNPELWLAPPQGWGILAARIMDNWGGFIKGQVVKVHSKDTGQDWTVKSYGGDGANSDPYYRENMVIGDLPGGDYLIWLPYQGSTYDLDLHITPGMVSYFTFHGKDGFGTKLPPTPGADFTPPGETPSPTP